MKIGVISDTHLRILDKRLEIIAEDHFKNVDVILHAGDLVNLDVLDVFRGKEIYAVRGNMDSESVIRELPEKRTLEIHGHRIGLIHGWGNPIGIEEKIIKEFEDIECLVFGHTHQAANKIIDDILFFNPGSPTDRRFSRCNTIGILDVEEEISGTIIEL
jgi:putative phosphoesterase